MKDFFAELKRRNVSKVAVAYAVVGWLVIQVAATIIPALHLPDGVTTAVVVLVLLGFPIALVIAWAFEMTPEGMKRTEDVSPDEKIPQWSKRKFAALVVTIALIAAGLLVFQLVGRDRWARRSHDQSTFDGGRPGGPALAMPDKSIAVLPFDNLSEDKANAYFAEGVQDEILTRLANVADLKVISRTSTQHFKSAPENLPEIAKQLGVTNIVEGSVQKVNDQVRVNVQLINATTDAHLWGDTYDRKLTDIFAVESDIAKTIADTLQAKLTGSERALLAKTPTANSEAYQLYLEGRFFWNKRTAGDLRKSVDYFNRAIEKDRNYAPAYAALAQGWVVLPAYNGGAPSDCFPQAEAAAQKALAIDESLSDAHAALAMVRTLYNFDFAGAIAEFERAIQLNPNDAMAHHWLGIHPLSYLGQNERAIAEVKRALELDPLSLIINTNLGQTCIYARRFDEAIAQLRKTLELDGNFYSARYLLGEALQLKGRIPEAIAEYQRGIAISDDPFLLGYLGFLYGSIGRADEAQQILQRLLEMRKQHYTEAYDVALLYLGLGNREEALNWLEQSYRERDGFGIGSIRVDPLLASLHGDARFEALADKIVPASQFKSAETSR